MCICVYVYLDLGDEVSKAEVQAVRDLISFLKEKQASFQEASEVRPNMYRM